MTNFFVRAEEAVAADLKVALTKAKGVFVDDVLPELKSFMEQFETDFGKAALAAAGQLVTGVLTNQITTVAAGIQIVQQLANQGLSIAEADAQRIALNALRIHLDAAATAPVVVAPVVAPVVVPGPDAETKDV